MQIVNSRPLVKSLNSDVLAGGAVTPNHLLLGRATVDVPEIKLSGKASLTRRMKYIEEVKSEFWAKWFAQVFPNLVPSYRWKKEKRDVQVGDVVMLKDASLLSKKFKLAVVSHVKKGADERVRSVKLKYKSVGGEGLTEVERSIHNVVVIVPVDWAQEDVEKAVQEDIHLLSGGVLGGVL